MICAGVDVGSMTAKAAIYDSESGQIVGAALQLTGWSPRESGHEALLAALDAAGAALPEIRRTVGTGYGRVSLPFVDEAITEISCHARGAHFLWPGVRTVIDIGGQDSKAIAVAPDGRPADFAMNDRCAAGTGRFLQVMATALGIELDELGAEALQCRAPASLSSVCTVFAESEVVGLIASGVPRRDIAGGLCQSVARRVAGLVQQVGARDDVVLTGGVARNDGVHGALQVILDHTIHRTPQPQFVGAIGAALLACERMRQREPV
jgi:(R)-2-hydroxyacyl-CoA dehydratese activating ATPase